MEEKIIFEQQHSVIEEVMNFNPSWLGRWGMIMLMIIFILLFVILFLIKFPSQISYPGKVEQVESAADSTVSVVFYIPQKHLAQYYEGQPVKASFVSYPDQQFGLVNGNITTVSDSTSRNDEFRVTAKLPADGLTDKKKKIRYRMGLVAEITISSGKESLLKKFIRTVK